VVDRNDELLRFAGSVLSAHDIGVHVPAGLLDTVIEER
jgi:hypothetical protein